MNKNIIILSCIFIFNLAFSWGSFAQEPKKVTTKFWVGGVCATCTQTIESALDVKGVVNAQYNLEKHELEVTYKTAKISEADLHRLLNEVGYDTSVSKASDEQYSKVHHCCKYREMENH